MEMTMASQKEFVSKVILMAGVALDELAMLEGEPDLAKTRAGIMSVKATLQELSAAAAKQGQEADR
jgi:hypothetical protein